MNYAEFLLEVTGTYHYELMHSLNSIDTNQDGFISSDELLGYFNVDIEKQVYEIMGIADIDRDGKVNYQEYLTVMSETGTCSLPRIPTTVSRPRGNLLTCRLLSPLASQPSKRDHSRAHSLCQQREEGFGWVRSRALADGTAGAAAGRALNYLKGAAEGETSTREPHECAIAAPRCDIILLFSGGNCEFT